MRDINTLIIHCSDTPNGRWHTATDIDRWHGEPDKNYRRAAVWVQRQNHHLKHIGYHYVIRTDGRLESGRAHDERGAHAYGHNDNSLGICLIGRDKYSVAQWVTLNLIINSLQHAYTLKKIIGHRDINKNKTCPGFSVEDFLAGGMAAPLAHTLMAA